LYRHCHSSTTNYLLFHDQEIGFITREEHKSKKQRSHGNQSAEWINTVVLLHMNGNGHFPGPNQPTSPVWLRKLDGMIGQVDLRHLGNTP
jgi:hypothetical protein